MAEVTAKDIAKRLGLSPSAVSLALNGKPGVSDKTRIMVMDMAAELGYTLPHSVIGANTPKKSICFLIYVDRVVSIAEHTSFSTFVLRGIEATASALGYTVIVRYLYASQPIQAQISDVLNEACGIVVLGTEITKNCLSEMEAFVEYASAVPIVVLDNTLLAFVITGENDDFITFFDVHGTSPYKTSDAREMIFMNPFSRSSRATGPKTRVPIGL